MKKKPVKRIRNSSTGKNVKDTGKPPKGYTYKYVWPDSDYATHRRKVLVKKKKR